jgi:hypothetical protein
MKLKFNNSWMSLYAKSMGKVFEITHATDNEKLQDSLYKRETIIAVSSLQNNPGFSLLAKAYAPAFRASELQDLNTDNCPYSNLYIEADGKFFQVALVTNDISQCNQFCSMRDDVSLIATDNAGRHYLVSSRAANRLGAAA